MIHCCLSVSPYGFKRSRTVFQNELWPPKADYTTPNEAAVRSKARAVLAEGVTAAVPVLLDVEQYSVDVRLVISHINPNTSTVDANIRKLQQIISWFREEAPTASLDLNRGVIGHLFDGTGDAPLIFNRKPLRHRPRTPALWL